MERGWVGRIDGDRVVHLAAQTLQSFFTGGGSAREHAEYPLADVRAPRARAPPAVGSPLRRPGSVRLREPGSGRRARRGPCDRRRRSSSGAPRLAAVIGADGAIGGFTALAEWRARALEPPKDRDFALGLGPRRRHAGRGARSRRRLRLGRRGRLRRRGYRALSRRPPRRPGGRAAPDRSTARASSSRSTGSAPSSSGVAG